MIYNPAPHRTMQFCDGTDWYGMKGGDTLSDLGADCANGEVPEWDGSEWICGAGGGGGADNLGDHTATTNLLMGGNRIKFTGVTSTAPPESGAGGGGGSTAWGDLTGVPAGFADGTDDGITAETDPKVGTLTNTKWCTTNGTTINCTSDAPSGGGSADVQTFTSSGTWTKPGSGTIAIVECIGGGGGGGRDNNYGGGGGGGAYVNKTFLLSALTATVAVTVGTGGAGRTGSDGAGINGGNSTFGAYLTAYGGAGGSDAYGGGGGGMTSAPSTVTPGNPRILAGWSYSPATGYSNAYSYSYYMGQGSGGTGHGQDGLYHGGGGGLGTSSSARNGGSSVYGGGGGGGGNGNGTAGTSMAAGNGGAGVDGGVGGNGTAPGGGGGGSEDNNGGNGAAGMCRVTTL